EKSLLRAQIFAGAHHVVIGDRDCRAPTLANGTQDEEIAERLRNAQTAGGGVRTLPEFAELRVLLERAYDWRTPFCLYGNHPWAFPANPAQLLHFVEGFPHADHADTATGGVK